MCNNCIHKTVCGKFADTGGHVRECEHYIEDRKGKWEDEFGGKYANPRYRCSLCKVRANYKMVQDELMSWHEEQALTDYCPNCGADMRGAEDVIQQ